MRVYGCGCVGEVMLSNALSLVNPISHSLYPRSDTGGDGHEGYYKHNQMDGTGWSKRTIQRTLRFRQGLWKENELVRWLGIEQNRKTESKTFQPTIQ